MGAGASSQLPLKKLKKRVFWKLSQCAVYMVAAPLQLPSGQFQV